MKAIKALPLHWEKTDGCYTYTPVVIIATDGASEKCILSTIHILVPILLMTETCKNYDMTEDKHVCQEFLDANYEIEERADGIFEVVYNEKHYSLNERLRISYQSTPQEEAEAIAREEEIIQNAESCLPLTLSQEEKEGLSAKGRAFIEAWRTSRKAPSGLSSEEKERLEAEYKAADDAYQEYLEPLLEAEDIKIGVDIPSFLSKEERAILSVKAKAVLEANRAYRKALSGLSHEDKGKLKAEYKAAYDAYQEYLQPLVEAEKKMIEAEEIAVEEYLKMLPSPEDEI